MPPLVGSKEDESTHTRWLNPQQLCGSVNPQIKYFSTMWKIVTPFKASPCDQVDTELLKQKKRHKTNS